MTDLRLVAKTVQLRAFNLDEESIIFDLFDGAVDFLPFPEVTQSDG